MLAIGHVLTRLLHLMAVIIGRSSVILYWLLVIIAYLHQLDYLLLCIVNQVGTYRD